MPSRTDTLPGMRKSIHSLEQDLLQSLLRQTREEAGLRQVDLAERLGKPQSFVSKYESGERRLDLIELRWVCLGMKIPLARFVKQFESMVKGTQEQSQTASENPADTHTLELDQV